MCPYAPQPRHDRPEPSKDTTKVFIFDQFGIETEVLLHRAPQRLDRLILREWEVMLVDISLAECFYDRTRGGECSGGIGRSRRARRG